MPPCSPVPWLAVLVVAAPAQLLCLRLPLRQLSSPGSCDAQFGVVAVLGLQEALLLSQPGLEDSFRSCDSSSGFGSCHAPRHSQRIRLHPILVAQHQNCASCPLFLGTSNSTPCLKNLCPDLELVCFSQKFRSLLVVPRGRVFISGETQEGIHVEELRGPASPTVAFFLASGEGIYLSLWPSNILNSCAIGEPCLQMFTTMMHL